MPTRKSWKSVITSGQDVSIIPLAQRLIREHGPQLWLLALAANRYNLGLTFKR